MATEVIVPKVDMVMETGTFIEWLKKEGDTVEKGDALFVILTDKTNIECEAPASGVLSGLNAKPNDVIPVAQVIAYILAPGEALPTQKIAQPKAVAQQSQVTLSVEKVAETVHAAAGNGNGKVRATPVARRLAAELGVDLEQLSGRGPLGRIQKADVLEFKQQPLKTETPVLAPSASVAQIRLSLPDARQKKAVPFTGVRKIIAERMAYSAFTAPHIMLSLHVDMTEAIRLRERVLEPLKARTGQKLSFTTILARAVATALPHHPFLNASLDGDKIILWEDVHLGIATSVDDGLIVPVIREAQNRNLEQITVAMSDLMERARNRRLTPAETMGSTFTISNLGMFGIESFTAIINPPESAILAVGKIVDTPVKSGDSFVFRPMMQLSACADHRIIDGVAVARFLDELKSTLENPYLLI
ncbi:MAG: 2-oxo acid dehydrogenase subunit E2 [Chloroflexi bacterium]|nr:2-oxo acid dehydrogenase subunit E2 [Chloroflexota bacterium]